jgi:predicted N-acetyltransferase YhbS
MSVMPAFRAIRSEDVAAVMAVQAECYVPAMIESDAVMAARIEAAGAHCWVAEDGAGVCAYLLCYPSHLDKVTRLGAAFACADLPDCLYLHDLAVARRAKGKGMGPGLVGRALAQAAAAGLRHSALVSVQDSRAFWERLGYRVRMPADATAAANLQSYVQPAWYMARELVRGDIALSSPGAR